MDFRAHFQYDVHITSIKNGQVALPRRSESENHNLLPIFDATDGVHSIALDIGLFVKLYGRCFLQLWVACH